MITMMQETTDLRHRGASAEIPGWDRRGKTGTSQDFASWFIGYTASLVTGVWLGKTTKSPTKTRRLAGLPVEVGPYLCAGANQGVPAGGAAHWPRRFSREPVPGRLASQRGAAAISGSAVRWRPIPAVEVSTGAGAGRRAACAAFTTGGVGSGRPGWMVAA